MHTKDLLLLSTVFFSALHLWHTSGLIPVAPPALANDAHAMTLTQTTSRTVWDGVYSAPQAARGKAAVVEHCAVCHLEDLSGDLAITMAPALKGEEFLANWDTRTLDELFTLIKSTMPQQMPGSLTDDLYRDALAFLLQANSFPEGADELTADAETLKQIRIVKTKP
jgi:cytochrome c